MLERRTGAKESGPCAPARRPGAHHRESYRRITRREDSSGKDASMYGDLRLHQLADGVPSRVPSALPFLPALTLALTFMMYLLYAEIGCCSGFTLESAARRINGTRIIFLSLLKRSKILPSEEGEGGMRGWSLRASLADIARGVGARGRLTGPVPVEHGLGGDG